MTQWLEAHRHEIEIGELVVLFQDECHLLWVDICGYVWGNKNERVEVPIVNEKERQTYLGAVNMRLVNVWFSHTQREMENILFNI
ncbi:MAG TPA: hypothetical protein VIQ31_36580 [Phormidium sp.]